MKTLLIDDEDSGRQLLRLFLGKHPELEIIGEATDGFQAFQMIKELHPDLIFLDIQMPKLTGLELLELLGDKAPIVIFSTAYDQYAIEAFNRNAVDYLLKPYTPIRVQQAVMRAQERWQNQQPNPTVDQLPKPLETLTRIAVKQRNQVVVIHLTEILALESEGDYVRIHTKHGHYLKEMTLKELEQRLGSEFVRCHRSWLIRWSAVRKIENVGSESWVAVLENDLKAKVSVEGRKGLRRILEG